MEHAKTVVGAADTNASENDGILYRARPHRLALLWPFALFAAVAALALLADAHVTGLGRLVGFRPDQASSLEHACRWLLMAVTAVFGLNAASSVIECRVTTYVVTPARVIASSRLIRATSSTVYLAKVEAIVRDQGPLERLCDVGSATLVGTGGTRDTLTNIREFSRFMAALDRSLPSAR